MVIAINIADYLEDNFYRRALLNTFLHIAAENTKDAFIVISKASAEPITSLANVRYVYIKHKYKPTAVNWLTYQVKISIALKKAKADLLLTPYIISSRLSKIPQGLLIPSVEYMSYPSFYSKAFLSYNKKHVTSFINRSKLIITSSGFSDKEIREFYKSKNTLILPVNKPKATAFLNQSSVQDYADGHPYFFCIHSATEVDGATNVLRSFSLFKKRLKSSMRLLISVNSSSCEAALKEVLKTYKYREDVKLINLNGEEQAKVMKDSYAVIISSIFADFEDATAALIESRLSVIAIDIPSVRYLFNEAALYFQAGDPPDLSDKLMMLYKDESLAKQLAAKPHNHSDKDINSLKEFWGQVKPKASL